MWPGRTKSAGPTLPFARLRTVSVRSSAEMPVVVPCLKSIETVNAVECGASFSATIGVRLSRRASSRVIGVQTMPEVWRTMNAILSGVQCTAATIRSPSFSRPSSSMTTTISPFSNARSASTIFFWSYAMSLTSLSCWRAGSAGRRRPAAPSALAPQSLARLPAMPQVVIRDRAGDHGLADRHRSDADARSVPPLGAHVDVVAVQVDGAARRQDRRGRLDREQRHRRLSGRDAAEDAAGVIRQENRVAVIADPHLVGILYAGHAR